MKLILSLALTISFAATASAASKAERAANKARECHEEVGNIANSKLFDQFDLTVNNPKLKKQIRNKITVLQDRLISFVAAETGCNEETESGSTDRYECYKDLYSNETNELIKEYKLGKILSTIPACK